MPYYIAPYIGSGTLTDPFRPRAADQPGWSAIDLRPDGGATLAGGGLNASFLYLPVANPDPQLILVAQDRLDAIGALLKQTCVTRLGLLASPTATVWEELVFELLLGPPPNGWKALRATHDGQYRVTLGPLVKTITAIRGGSSASENWNCADQSGLTCQNTWGDNSAVWSILSNQARLSTTSGVQGWGRAEVDLATDNHYAQVTIVASTEDGANANYGGPLIRKDSTTTSTYYMAAFTRATGVNEHVLYKFVAGSGTQLGSSDPVDFAAGEVVKVSANGSSISAFRNGTEMTMSPQTDMAISGNVRAGIFGLSQGTTGTVDYDNWSAADLGADINASGTSQIFYRPRLRVY